MLTLRLFRAAEPFQQIAVRTLGEGELVVGRDPSVQWPVEDTACELSRQHCQIAVQQDRILLRDLSANGVFVGSDRRRAPRGVDVELAPDDTLYLGRFMIVLEWETPAPANDVDTAPPPFHFPILQALAIKPEDFVVRSEWADAAPERSVESKERGGITDAALLDAFCEGANLDPSAFAGADAMEVMHRLGGIYQQVVLGLSALINERKAVKAEFSMDRTTVGPANNNPLKWAPTQRLAVDLLCARDDGFLAGPDALKASFEDIRKHTLCLLAGSRAAVAATLTALDPKEMQSSAKPQSMLFTSRSEAYWRHFEHRHDQIANAERHSPENEINRAFKAGYERQLRELDAMEARS